MFQLILDQCLRDEVDTISDMLEERGALSVTMTDRYDSPILEPEIGTTPLWADVIIQALYQTKEEGQLALAHLCATYPHLRGDLEPVPEQDWERVCMADFKPQQFGNRLWICPSWLTPPNPEAVNLILDPGLAFGTGTHPTTSLCLTWLDQADLKNKQVLDYGCGSGILALAALKLGANHVAAVDLDDQALIATRNNAQSNHISDNMLSVSLPHEVNEPVDVLIANILLSPLIQLKTVFKGLLKNEGLLVVSGILNEQTAQLIEEYQGCFSHQNTVSQGDWSLMVFNRLV